MKSQKKKIKLAFLHFSRSNYSGAQKNLFRLIQSLDKSIVTPSLITNEENELVIKLRTIGVHCNIIHFGELLSLQDKRILKFSPLQNLKTLLEIIEYNKTLTSHFRSNFYDIVIYEDIRMLMTAFLAVKRSKLPSIWKLFSEEKGWITKSLYLAGSFLCNSINYNYYKQEKNIFGKLSTLKYLKNKSYVIYAGIDECVPTSRNARIEFGYTLDDCVLLMASNIYPLKGQLDLVKTVIKLQCKFTHIKLILAGTHIHNNERSAEYYEQIFSLIKESNSYNNIKLTGWRTDIFDLINDCDVYVSSSYSESLPAAVRDAMRLGKPIVATDVGGTSELVTSACGFLYKPGDLNTLEILLTRLILNKDERTQLGENGRRMVENNFSNLRYASETTQMLHETLEKYHKSIWNFNA